MPKKNETRKGKKFRDGDGQSSGQPTSSHFYKGDKSSEGPKQAWGGQK